MILPNLQVTNKSKRRQVRNETKQGSLRLRTHNIVGPMDRLTEV